MNTNTEHSMLCQCTSPLITYETYVDAIQSYNGKSLIGVDRIKDYIWRNDKPLNYDWPNHPKSQDLSDKFYKLNFGIVIISKEEFNKYNNIKTPVSDLYSIPIDESLDIDNVVEFELAERMYEE